MFGSWVNSVEYRGIDCVLIVSASKFSVIIVVGKVRRIKSTISIFSAPIVISSIFAIKELVIFGWSPVAPAAFSSRKLRSSFWRLIISLWEQALRAWSSGDCKMISGGIWKLAVTDGGKLSRFLSICEVKQAAMNLIVLEAWRRSWALVTVGHLATYVCAAPIPRISLWALSRYAVDQSNESTLLIQAYIGLHRILYMLVLRVIPRASGTVCCWGTTFGDGTRSNIERLHSMYQKLYESRK